MTAPTAAQREQLLDLLTHHRRPLTIAAGAVGLSPSEAHDIATDAGYPNMHRVRQALEQLRDPAKVDTAEATAERFRTLCRAQLLGLVKRAEAIDSAGLQGQAKAVLDRYDALVPKLTAAEVKHGNAARIAELQAELARLAPDQSLPASRARARENCSSCQVAGRACWLHGGVGKVLAEPERAVWRQAEAGTLQHLVLAGRALCAADDAGPWRAVAGVAKCTACLELEEVLARHG